MRFEDVLDSHNLKFDLHWRRLVVFCLSVEQRFWLDDFVADQFKKHGKIAPILYKTFKDAFIQHYGITTAEKQALASNILKAMRMEVTESIEAFIKRFLM